MTPSKQVHVVVVLDAEYKEDIVNGGTFIYRTRPTFTKEAALARARKAMEKSILADWHGDGETGYTMTEAKAFVEQAYTFYHSVGTLPKGL